MLDDAIITFTSKIWLYEGGKASWHFITLPLESAAQVKFFVGDRKTKGWGAVPVKATIGQTSWQTSIFPDKKYGSYLLPIKADVRKKQTLSEGNAVDVSLSLSF